MLGAISSEETLGSQSVAGHLTRLATCVFVCVLVKIVKNHAVANGGGDAEGGERESGSVGKLRPEARSQSFFLDNCWDRMCRLVHHSSRPHSCAVGEKIYKRTCTPQTLHLELIPHLLPTPHTQHKLQQQVLFCSSRYRISQHA